MTKKTVQECLATLGVSNDELSACDDLDQEFVIIKQSYREKVLAAHPDKGGDPATFRQVRASFEVLRNMYSHRRTVGDSFASSGSNEAGSYYDQVWKDFEGMPTPSWDYFYTAAEEPVPTYRVELAKSYRSRCRQKVQKAKMCTDPFIAKGEVRVGWMHAETGESRRTYASSQHSLSSGDDKQTHCGMATNYPFTLEKFLLLCRVVWKLVPFNVLAGPQQGMAWIARS